MTAVFCQNAADRKAETWENQLAPFDRLEFAISDAAKGIAAAVGDGPGRRDDPTAPTLEHGLDVFHTTMEAKRVLAQHWRARRGGLGEGRGRRPRGRLLEVARDRRPRRGPAAQLAWIRATASLEQTERLEAAGVGPTPPWTCSGPTADSTTAAHAEPRSPRPSRS